MKYILAVVLVLIAATVYFITRPQPEFAAGRPQPLLKQEAVVESTPADPAATEAEARRTEMNAEFEELKKARRNLESRLARMKAVAWGIELAREETEVINEQMKNGYALLKNQRLMGAYSSVSEIREERARIEFINENLKQVEERFRAQRRQ